MNQNISFPGKLRNMTSIYLTYQGKILMLFRQGSSVVNNLWIGSAGGHFEKDELNDARACVLRELQEEMSLTESMLEDFHLRYITLRQLNGEIRQNYYFFAELKSLETLQLQSNEGIVKWFPINEELNHLEMPFSAQFVIAHYLQTGRFTDMIYGGIASGDKVVFTELTNG